MRFIGPYPLGRNRDAYERLVCRSRLTRVTLSGLKDHAVRFGWVLPMEFDDCSSGAFVYEYKDPSETRYMRMDLEPAGNNAMDRAASDLGVQLEFVNQQLHVVSLSDSSTLNACGIERGDVILQWDGNIITSKEMFDAIYDTAKPGYAVTLRVRHPSDRTRVICGFFRMPRPSGTEESESLQVFVWGWTCVRASHCAVGRCRMAPLTYPAILPYNPYLLCIATHLQGDGVRLAQSVCACYTDVLCLEWGDMGFP